MATGVKPQNLAVNDGINWADQFGVTTGVDDLEVVVFGSKGNYFCLGFYTGSGITVANYNGLPINSIIIDCAVAFKTYMHSAATTWKTSAASS